MALRAINCISRGYRGAARGVMPLLTIKTNNYFTYTNEISHPLKRDPKIVAAEEAMSVIKSGDTVFVQGAAATPINLIEAMTKHGMANKLKDVTVCHMHTEGKAAYCDPENAEHFRSCSFFMGGNVRKAVADGRGDNIAIFLHEIPYSFYKGIYKPDVALVHVSPPDQHGYCSLGTSVDCVRAGLMHSKVIVAQINKQMPRTFGDGIIHQSHFDYANYTSIIARNPRMTAINSCLEVEVEDALIQHLARRTDILMI